MSESDWIPYGGEYSGEIPGEPSDYEIEIQRTEDVSKVLVRLGECFEAGDSDRASRIVFHSLFDRRGYLTDYLDNLSGDNYHVAPNQGYNIARNTIIAELEEQESILYRNIRAYMEIGEFKEALVLAYDQNLVHQTDLFGHPNPENVGLGLGNEVVSLPEEEIDEIDKYIHIDLDKAMICAINDLDTEELWQLLDIKTRVVLDLVNDNPEDIDQIMLDSEIDFAHVLILYLNLFDVPKGKTE